MQTGKHGTYSVCSAIEEHVWCKSTPHQFKKGEMNMCEFCDGKEKKNRKRIYIWQRLYNQKSLEQVLFAQLRQ